jgi:hypothetical protein
VRLIVLQNKYHEDSVVKAKTEYAHNPAASSDMKYQMIWVSEADKDLPF